jgi:hypothetical protein
MGNIIDIRDAVPHPLKDLSTFLELTSDTIGHFSLQDNDISEEFINWLAKYRVEIKLAEVFYCAPGAEVPVHSDDIEPVGCCKLSWAFGKTAVPMEWYEVQQGTELFYKNNSIGGYYLTCSPEHYSLSEIGYINNPSLVRVDILHGVRNLTHTPWWCLCIVPRKINGSHHRITWDEALEIFKEVING